MVKLDCYYVVWFVGGYFGCVVIVFVKEFICVVLVGLWYGSDFVKYWVVVRCDGDGYWWDFGFYWLLVDFEWIGCGSVVLWWRCVGYLGGVLVMNWVDELSGVVVVGVDVGVG